VTEWVVVRQKGRCASGRGYGRLSVVLSKRQWRVRESWVNAWAESSVRTHTPGPTSGLAITKDRGPMAEGDSSHQTARKSSAPPLHVYWPPQSSGRRTPTSSSWPKPPPLGQSVDSLPPGACSRRQTATLHWSCMDERRVAFRGRGSSTVLSTTVLSYPPHLAIHPQRPRASPLWLRRPALAACIDYLGPPALCVARVARRSLLSTAPARPFCCDKEAHRHPLSPPAQWLPQGRGMRRRATFPARRKRRPTRRAH
jgi:hypothetical protein